MTQERIHELFDWLIQTKQVSHRNLQKVRWVEFEYGAQTSDRLRFGRAGDYMISEASLAVEHPQVYANGRQQSRIRITIKVVVNSSPRPLSEKEKASLHLIGYDDALALPIDGDDSNDGWSSQKHYRGYGFLMPRIHAAGTDDLRAGESFEFYVSAGPREAGHVKRLAFQIHGDDGGIYRTNGWCTRPDGKEEYLGHMDIRFDNTVDALPPPTYQAAQIELNGQRPLLPIENHTVTLSIFDGGRPVGIRRIHCTPAGMIHWYRNSGASPCFTGYAGPGDDAYHWNPEVPKGMQPLPLAETIREPTIVVCARNDISRDDQRDPPQGPVIVELVDDFGTTLRRRLAFDPDARERLTIS